HGGRLACGLSAKAEHEPARRMAAVTDESSASDLKLVIVGAGRMGGAVLQGAVAAGVLSADEVAIYHPNERRGSELSERFGVQHVADSRLSRAAGVLLAVKPQSFKRAAPVVARRDASFVSLRAGVPARHIAERVGSRRVIRAMPNLGAALGVSATALAALPEATPEDVAMARSL